MSPRKPFKFGGEKPSSAGGAGTHNPASTQDEAADAGITVFEAGTEAMTADGEVGAVEEPEQDGGRPTFGPAIPFPEAKGPKKPYKI